MRLKPRADLQGWRIDLDIATLPEEAANGVQDAPTLREPCAPQYEAIGPPPFLHRSALVIPGVATYVTYSEASPISPPRSRQ
jgi:hypothetical protein